MSKLRSSRQGLLDEDYVKVLLSTPFDVEPYRKAMRERLQSKKKSQAVWPVSPPQEPLPDNVILFKRPEKKK